MKLWWIVLLALLAVSVGPAFGKQDVLKGPDGKTLAVVLDCSSCEKPGKTCQTGVEDGFHDGSRCGQCLIKKNYGRIIALPYDMRISGHLKDENGKPIEGKYVHLFLPNSWSVRTRTLKDGMFMLRMGATVKRKGKKPVSLDLGDRTMRSDSKTSSYSLFMLPEDHQACDPKKKDKK